MLYGLHGYYGQGYGSESFTVQTIEGEPLHTPRGSYDAPILGMHRSTQEAIIYHNGSPVQQENSVFTGLDGDEEPPSTCTSATYSNDSLGHATNITVIDVKNTSVVRAIYEASYRDDNGKDGQLLRWDIDESGVRTEYQYDSLKRLTQARRVGITNALASIPDLVTNNTYDAFSRLILQTASGGGLSLTSRWAYDVAGRLRMQVSPDELTNSYSYVIDHGQVVINTLPNGKTVTRTNYLEGRLKSLTGDGVVAEFHTNSVSGGSDFNLTLIDTVHYGAPNSPRSTVNGSNILGLPSLTRKLDYDGVNFVEQCTYYDDFLNRPARITQTGKASSYLLEFDGQASQTSEGDPGLASGGRITVSLSQYASIGGEWFYAQTNSVFLGDDSDVPTVVGVELQRLSGFTSASVLSQTTRWDADTNATFVDRVPRPSCQEAYPGHRYRPIDAQCHQSLHQRPVDLREHPHRRRSRSTPL